MFSSSLNSEIIISMSKKLVYYSFAMVVEQTDNPLAKQNYMYTISSASRMMRCLQ